MIFGLVAGILVSCRGVSVTDVPNATMEKTNLPTPMNMVTTVMTDVPTSQPSSIPIVATLTATLRSTPTISPTPEPRSFVEFTVAECTSNFCPPPWLNEQAGKLIGLPGIIDSEALSELQVRITYDATMLTEDDVIQLFEDEIGLTASP